jgi:hypothetical protein
MVYVVLQRIILVQMEAPVLRLFYKESYWYKRQLQWLCGSTKNPGTNEGSSFYVVLQRIMQVQLEIPGSMWFYKE